MTRAEEEALEERSSASKVRRARLCDRSGKPIAALNIPAWAKAPEILVAGTRTFVLETWRAEVGLEDADAELRYIEAFSYVVPDPGGHPETLAQQLTELREARQFKRAVLDPLMQPSDFGTVLVRIVDAMGGQGFSDRAGEAHRLMASSQGG